VPDGQNILKRLYDEELGASEIIEQPKPSAASAGQCRIQKHIKSTRTNFIL